MSLWNVIGAFVTTLRWPAINLESCNMAHRQFIPLNDGRAGFINGPWPLPSIPREGRERPSPTRYITGWRVPLLTCAKLVFLLLWFALTIIMRHNLAWGPFFLQCWPLTLVTLKLNQTLIFVKGSGGFFFFNTPYVHSSFSTRSKWNFNVRPLLRVRESARQGPGAKGGGRWCRENKLCSCNYMGEGDRDYLSPDIGSSHLSLPGRNDIFRKNKKHKMHPCMYDYVCMSSSPLLPHPYTHQTLLLPLPHLITTSLSYRVCKCLRLGSGPCYQG